MAVRTTDDEIWYWYEQIVKFQSQSQMQSEFCHDNNLDYRKFTSKYRRIVYVKRSNPKLYEKVMPLARQFLESDMTPREFCKINDISLNDLKEASSHLRYWQVIDRMKQDREERPMQFIKVPAVQSRIPTMQEPIEPEVMRKQNDVELIISAGVKVVVAPEVGADKLVRIIELLKDL